MKNLITIGLPSKGRLREGAIQFFEKNNFKLTSNGGERNYFAEFENYPNIQIIYLHAQEIIQRSILSGKYIFEVKKYFLQSQRSI